MTTATKAPNAEYLASPRRLKEMEDPDAARAAGFKVLAEAEKLKGELAAQREREALARQRLYECEFSRLTRELAAETKERDRLETLMENLRNSGQAKIIRNQHPLIMPTWWALNRLWNDVRQQGNSQTSQKNWKKIRRDADAVKALMSQVEALKLTDCNPLFRLKDICKRAGIEMPTLPQPIFKTEIEDDDDE